MARKTVLMKSKDMMSRQDAALFLRQLADKLESGNVTLIQGTQEVMLAIPDRVRVEVEADEKPKPHGGIQHSLEVEIEWRTGPEGEMDGGLELG